MLTSTEKFITRVHLALCIRDMKERREQQDREITHNIKKTLRRVDEMIASAGDDEELKLAFYKMRAVLLRDLDQCSAESRARYLVECMEEMETTLTIVTEEE